MLEKFPVKRNLRSDYIALFIGIAVLISILVALRFSIVTDHIYSAMVKDPVREAPAGRIMVAPADGTVLYVKRVQNGIIPPIIKNGVQVPVSDYLKSGTEDVITDGFLIGIHMNLHGVHINRAPISGSLIQQTVFNGPHLDMSKIETSVILAELIPGWLSLKKLLGLSPFVIDDSNNYVLNSARETLAFQDIRDRRTYVIRIADYHLGKVLTWVNDTQPIATGDKLGMITWGSQTDVLIENSPGLSIQAQAGDRVYGGESIIANY